MINTKNILTVDDATTISDNDTLFVGQNSQLKQIDYDLLADAILNKISSKSYSELDTTAKTLIGAIDELNSNIPIFSNAGSHNGIFRGKNLGTSVTQKQWTAIQNGTFDDLYIGDYWVIGGVNWRIAAFDYYYNTGDTAFAKHHAVIVPDTALYSHNMDDTNTTVGAYVGSGMYTEGLEQAKTQIQNAFGASHVLTHRLLLTNATTNGYASGGEWIDSIVDLMCETMVYGSMIISPMNNGTNIPYNYRIEKGQLPLFQMAPQYTFNRSGTYWLRDVVSSASFAIVISYGGANYRGASRVCGVRPAFCIG